MFFASLMLGLLWKRGLPPLLITAFVIATGLLFTGCRGMGTQSFTAFAPAQAHELEASSQTVLDVTCSNVMAQADYNLWENLSMLAPMPKYWEYDMTLQVERVVKGDFDEKTIELHWLREPTRAQRNVLRVSETWPFGITNGTRLRISFEGRSGSYLKNLKIMIRP